MTRFNAALALAVVLAVPPATFSQQSDGFDAQPKSPEASLRDWKPRPGFVVELAAAEPLVQDPVAIAWGPDGKLWVAEMGDYPSGTDGKGRFGGKVRFLEDTDGDGRYDRATVFLDNLPFPTGVMPWRKGVLVTCAPDILYAEDLDGDGKADRRTALYSGFREGNQQHRVNGFVWGLDNWVYGANGDSGGVVRSAKTGQTVDLRGRDFRIRPDEGAIDLQTGQTQYGRSRDDWGNWFGCHNVNPAWHFALADHYLRRNPSLFPPEPRVKVPTEAGLPRVYPRSRTLTRFNDYHTANRFTSACGIGIYRDELFGPDFAGNLFICEPVHDLVSRLVLTAEGSTFRGRRADDERESEFLASVDNWCRPVQVQTGPDGALWVADMYRLVIEHPQWIPLDWQKRLDVRAGHDKGRIYRVYPTGAKPRAIPRLDKLTTTELVAALDSPSGWQRDTVQQLLVWRRDPSAIPLLEKLATAGERPLARLHALCALDGMSALRPELVQRSLADPHPGVRRHAIRLSEPFLSQAPELGAAAAKLVNDADPQVRMQLAYTLGEWNDPRAGAALGDLAVKAAGDRFLTTAVLSSVRASNFDGVLLVVLKNSAHAPPALAEELLRQADALGNVRATTALLNAIAAPTQGRYSPWQFTALAGLLDGLDRRSSSLKRLADGGNDELRQVIERLAGVFAAARSVAIDSAARLDDRLQAVRLLGRGRDQQAEDCERLATLLVPQHPESLQTAAVTALGRSQDAKTPERLLRGWAGYSPAVRAQVLEMLARRGEWLRAVLDAVERGDVDANEIDAVRRDQLLRHRDATVRGRAERLLRGAANPDRQKVIDEYRGVAELKGDPGRGQPLYAKHCASCHKLAGTGGEVGPDLSALSGKPADYLLTALLDPNRAVEPRYLTYVAQTKSGLTLTGVLASESGNRITLLSADGKPQEVLRSDLESLSSTGRSMMPEGLEKDLKPQEIADLLAHLRSAAPPLPGAR